MTAMAVALLAVMSLLCKNGPYVEGSYQKDSLIGSFWGKRHLKPEIVEEMELVIENESMYDFRKSILDDQAPINAVLDEANIEQNETKHLYRVKYSQERRQEGEPFEFKVESPMKVQGSGTKRVNRPMEEKIIEMMNSSSDKMYQSLNPSSLQSPDKRRGRPMNTYMLPSSAKQNTMENKESG